MEIQVIETLKFYLLDHPSIIWFRWSHTQSWGSTWPFLFAAVAIYVTTTLTLHFLLNLLRCRRPVRLGPIPAIHSLMMCAVSAVIFSGMILSAAAEAKDTRWLWRRVRATPLEYFLCFPLGTRPSGRVFFWSYLFYLSRFLHFLRTFSAVFRHRRIPFFRLFHHSMLLIMSFLWLEFSQSFQVLAILFSTLVYTMVYGYRFLEEIGLGCKEGFCFRMSGQMVVLGFNLVCHVGVICLHFLRGGCNGIGAWVFNSVLNAALLFLFFKSHVKHKNAN